MATPNAAVNTAVARAIAGWQGIIADSIRAEVERVRGLEKECELEVSCG